MSRDNKYKLPDFHHRTDFESVFVFSPLAVSRSGGVRALTSDQRFTNQ